MLATLDDLKDNLGIEDSDSDTALGNAVTMANAILAGYIGGDLSDVETDRIFTKVLPDPARYVNLPVWPVISITGITNNGVAVPEGDYELDERLGCVNFVNSGLICTTAHSYRSNRTTVTYKAGFDPVPEDLFTVCINIAATIYNNGGNFVNAMNGGKGELKSMTMFDAMSMSFETNAGSDAESAGTPAGMLKAWSFILDKYRCNSPVMA